MSNRPNERQYDWPPGVKRPAPRQAALDFLRRYWGLEAMQRQRTLVAVPLLPLGEDEEEDD